MWGWGCVQLGGVLISSGFIGDGDLCGVGVVYNWVGLGCVNI